MSEWISTFPGYGQVLATAKKCFGRIIRTGPTPRHIGIIMDGNRRYAKAHKMELKEGHNLGFQLMGSNLELLYEAGVQSVTVYAFSIENFKRLKFEVDWLMELAKLKLQELCQHGDLCEQYGIRIRILGNIAMLPADVRDVLHQTEAMTKDNQRAVLNVCFPYTSRDDMTHAVKEVVLQSIADPSLCIDEALLNDNLYTKDCPPLDILVRTSGTYRLSDFLLWQCVPLTCTVVFIEKLWPEFTPWDMCKILINWGFNMYWYGRGSGAYTVTTRTSTWGRFLAGDGVGADLAQMVDDVGKRVDSLAKTGSGGYTSGFGRFGAENDIEEDGEDDDDEDEDDEDDEEDGEDDTAPSSEE